MPANIWSPLRRWKVVGYHRPLKTVIFQLQIRLAAAAFPERLRLTRAGTRDSYSNNFKGFLIVPATVHPHCYLAQFRNELGRIAKVCRQTRRLHNEELSSQRMGTFSCTEKLLFQIGVRVFQNFVPDILVSIVTPTCLVGDQFCTRSINLWQLNL